MVQSDAGQSYIPQVYESGDHTQNHEKEIFASSFFTGVSFTVDRFEEPSDDNFILLKRSLNHENGSYGQTTDS